MSETGNALHAATVLPGITRLVEHNGRVKRGERAVIVTDFDKFEYANLLAGVIAAKGAEPVICVMSPRASDGAEPPQAVAAAMLEADVIFSPVARSITHTRAMRAANERGARSILMTHHDRSVLTAPSLLTTNFEEQKPVCRRLGKALAAGSSVRVTAPGGTDISFALEATRKPNVLTGQPDAGELAPVPTIEVNVVPLEGTANGVIVADCSMPYLGVGVLEEPITCKVVDGFIVDVQGGWQARRVAEMWESLNDPNCYNVAELGIGLNPNARPTGVMLEDEGILGTVHFGIGTSYTLGGTIVAPSHYDFLVWHPTVEVDGRPILKDTEVLA